MYKFQGNWHFIGYNMLKKKNMFAINQILEKKKGPISAEQ